MTATVTTLIPLERGDVILVGDKLEKVVEDLGGGVYALTSISWWDRCSVEMTMWWRRGRRLLRDGIGDNVRLVRRWLLHLHRDGADGGLTAAELAVTADGTLRCRCGHWDNIHGMFCMASRCGCLEFRLKSDKTARY